MANPSFLLSLKILMILILACWISIWILKPTRLWTQKWKDAEDSARTTVFGYYGLNFAVYTFPIIALAIVGFVYLSFNPYRPKKRLVRRWTAGFSNPLIIKSPLGILSGLELLGIFLFIVFLVWTFYARISNDFKTMKPDKNLNLSLWQYKYFRVATRFGLLAEVCLALLLIPILRGMALFKLVGIQFEASVRYHVWLGTSMIFFATFHGVSTLFIWGIKDQLQVQIWRWQKTGRIYLAGEIALVTGLVIWITSLPFVRRKWFEIFYYTHHLYVVFFVFFLFHTGDRHFYMIFPGVFLFGIDKLLRIIQSRPLTCVLSANIYPCKAIELILPKDPRLKYTPTNVIFVKVPSISKFQWHSFSITSCSNDETISILIKCEGWWTNCLYNMINDDQNLYHDRTVFIPIAIEGPYGPTSMDFLEYDTLLLVAGGIGITPCLSILNELSFKQGTNKCKLPTRVQLIFVVKKFHDISLLNSISHLFLNCPMKKFHLKLKFFVTREKKSATTFRELLNEFSQVQTIDFDIKSSNYTIHGLETLPWMAFIIGFSSIVFLVSLSFLNHAFLPITKKTLKQKNPSSVIDILFISSFIIALLCSIFVAILLRWKKLRKGILLVNNKKPEAVKERSLTDGLEEHEIHIGERPNFKDILGDFANENGGSEIGLLVCGPDSMSESVALSCQKYSRDSNDVGMGKKKKKRPNYNLHSLNFTL